MTTASAPVTTRVGTGVDLLGESPVWDPRLQRLYWVDGVRPALRYLDPATGAVTDVAVPSTIGSVALTEDPDHVLVALVDGIHRATVATGELEPLYVPAPGDPRVRFNDGKVDRQGRFVVGTMGVRAEPLGELVRLSPDGTVEVLTTGIRISNAVCFSPDGGTLYFADSLDHAVRAYPYSPGPGPLGEPRVLADTDPWGSGPDGATVDAEGMVWVALIAAGTVARLRPDGSLDRMVDAPVDLPSCIGFGGPDLTTLYLTSIKDSGTGRAVSRHPDGGGLFALDGLGVVGLPEPYFGTSPARGA
ncbi:SMP-30/gluconolactonase/LRE family protein [Klenkia sp. LSe6-5]|uniref:SMP-30/gluconolactonase/LRE family protein n=1 Tax=Klenkia sesuvii TaxID=3103137 RepID=A0ABU8DYX2_9ACTN